MHRKYDWMGTPAKIPRNCFYVIRVQHTPPFIHEYSNAAIFTSSSSLPSPSSLVGGSGGGDEKVPVTSPDKCRVVDVQQSADLQ